MAAHLPGMCAAIFPMPVIGIPMHTTSLGGRDSLYSIVQMPSGIPVATVAINGGANAGILAAKILGYRRSGTAAEGKGLRRGAEKPGGSQGREASAGGLQKLYKISGGSYGLQAFRRRYRSRIQSGGTDEKACGQNGKAGDAGRDWAVFSGAFSMDKFKNMEHPTLVSGTDGVGTKLKLAFLMDKHDTVGIDCVAMCVNDIACAGGEPLFFLDYIACGKNIPERIADIVSGVAEGCVQAGAALIGGETAEMPGFYPEDEYDLAGFAVGVVDEKDLITGSSLSSGDILIGMASSGVHSNGFSLVRKVFEMSRESLETYYEELGTTLGEALLAPTKIYVKALKSIKDAGVTVKACSHITGGGFYENVPRMLREDVDALIQKDSYPVPPIFKLLAKKGQVEEHVMYNTYNMGIGMIVAVNPEDVDTAMRAIEAAGEKPYIIGHIESGKKQVQLI